LCQKYGEMSFSLYWPGSGSTCSQTGDEDERGGDEDV